MCVCVFVCVLVFVCVFEAESVIFQIFEWTLTLQNWQNSYFSQALCAAEKKAPELVWRDQGVLVSKAVNDYMSSFSFGPGSGQHPVPSRSTSWPSAMPATDGHRAAAVPDHACVSGPSME